LWNRTKKNLKTLPQLKQQHKLRVIISGGGTGGHIFPAIAIANYIKQNVPDSDILFIGARGRMEMEKVPAAGYKIVGLPISGFQRKWKWENLLLPFKIARSFYRAANVIRQYKPDVVVGFGGFASGPVLYISSLLGKPTVIQEQNSYAGVTNKILSRRAKAICVAYDKMEKFFPKDKVFLTGNPVRKDFIQFNATREEGLKFFGLNPNRKTILVIGGSLGSLTLNDSVRNFISGIKHSDVQVIWQTGRGYFNKAKAAAADCADRVKVFYFINRMDLAYASADIVVSRAGALSIAELTVVGKAAVLVPSPNVAEDHQTKNAMALVDKDAAVLVKDADARQALFPTVLALLKDEAKLFTLRNNISQMAIRDADARITEKILEFAKSK